MPFMQKQIEHMQVWSIDGHNGTTCFPAEYFTEDQARENYGSEIWS